MQVMGFICYWGFQEALKKISETFKDSSHLEQKKKSLFMCRNGCVENFKKKQK